MTKIRMNTNWYTKKMINLLQSGEVIFLTKKLNRNLMGYCFGDLIAFDHRKDCFLRTLIHEMFHNLYPPVLKKNCLNKSNENKIIRMTERYMLYSSWNEKRRLLYAILEEIPGRTVLKFSK
jgi:hypothetical protein